MKIKLSKSQWEGIGKKTGWIKTAGDEYPKVCPECKGNKFVYRKLKNLGTLNWSEHVLSCDTCGGKGYITKEDHDWARHREGLIPHPNT